MDTATSTYAIAAIGVCYAIASTLIIKYIGNPGRIKQIQDESNLLQKELSEAMKTKDDAKINEVNKRYETFMPKMGEMMILQLKPMVVILPLLVVLTGQLRSWFAEFVIQLPFSLPIVIQHFEKFPNWRDTFGVIGWFYICVFAAGLSISIIKSVYDKFIKKAIAEKLISK